MKWPCVQLNKYVNEPLKFDENIDFSANVANFSDVSGISSTHVYGSILALGADAYDLECTIETTLHMHDSMTWELVDVPLNLNFDEVEARYPELEDDRPINNDVINLDEIVWEYIVLNKPFRVSKKD